MAAVVTLTVEPARPVARQRVTLTAQVRPAAAKAVQPDQVPTGTVNFLLDQSLLASVPVDSDGFASFDTEMPAGAHTVGAVYSGDQGTASNEVVLTVDPASTTTTLTSAPNPSFCNGTVTFTAQVTPVPPATGIPTGTVTFVVSADGPSLTAPLDATGQAQVTESGLSIGTHQAIASYSGDTNFGPSSSNLVNQTVTLAPSQTNVTVSPSPSVCGQTVTVCAVVTAGSGASGTPSGSVTFTGPGGLNVTVPLDAGGNACFTTSSLSTGTINAQYSGDGCFATSTGSAPVTVNQAGSALALSVSPSPSVCGQPVTVCATVTAVAPGTGTPTGTVTFNGPGGFNVTAFLDASGKACVTTSTLKSGSLTAVYNGDSCFGSSTNTTQVTVNPASPRVQVSVSPSPSVCGQPVTVCVTVAAAPPSTGTPTGTVTFTGPGGLNQTATLDTAGKACITTTALQSGTVTATYNGDACFTAGTAVVPVTVNKASTTTSVTVNPSPSVCGQLVTVCAQVAAVPPGSGTPTGTVTFTTGSTSVTVNVDANGKACLVTAFHASTSVTATYNGDSCFNGSSGSGTVTVNKASSTTSLLVSPVPSVCGQPVTICAQVAAVAPGSGTPTGTITFTGPGGFSQTATLDANGRSCVTTSSLQSGTVTATYSGDGCFTTSAAASSVTVNPASSTVVVTATPNPSVCGQSVTVCAQVSAVAPSTAVPGGTVTFTGPGGLNQTATLDATGKACITTTALQSGTVTAVYSGNACFTGSTGTLPVTVNPASSTVVVTATPNPSVCGQSVTVCAQVSAVAPSTAVPGGTVTFTGPGGLNQTATLDATGKACITTTALQSGTVTAVYSGNACFTGSTGTLPVTVNAVNTTLTAGPAQIRLRVNGTFVIPAMSATLKTTGGAPVVGQTVTFRANAVGGPILLGTATTDGSGVATLAPPQLTVPSTVITATSYTASFAGTPCYNASSVTAPLSLVLFPLLP
ncbi:Ig-like domain-containing protein [Streptomyces sp. NPDC096012]|uniref:beta strand repeat-containing protein n=1 Tax=Streptomyces sp. NPDC096012 TaxID=3155684 RepID=UPI00336A8593